MPGMPGKGVEVNTKKWYASKTIWINAALAFAAVVVEGIPPDLMVWGFPVVALVNMALRAISNKGLTA